MAKIRDSQPKNASGSYDRLFDNHEIGNLMTRVQSTVIRNGVELEKIIVAQVSDSGFLINNLDDFMKNTSLHTGDKSAYLCPKSVVCKSKFKQKNQPDFLIFNKQKGKIICWVVELKDGDTFDTKKALGEKEHLEDFTKKFTEQLKNVPNCDVRYAVCCFNQNDKEAIKFGFKGVFNNEYILTGKELCEMLNLNYEQIVKSRKRDAKDNLDYFLEQLFGIDAVRNTLEENQYN